MHKNTFILVVFLAIIAALLVGFNVGKKMQQPQEIAQPTPTTALSPTPEPVATKPYTNAYCKVAVTYPITMTVAEPATGSATFTSNQESVVLVCQKDIPGIAVGEENQTTITIGSTSGILYHTATPKDGTPIDIFLITHPKTNMDILISGIGSAFTTILESLTLLP